MTETILKQKLKTYSLDAWQQTLTDLFGTRYQPLNQPVSLFSIKDVVRDCRQFGSITLDDGKRIALLETDVEDHKRIAINRVELRNVVERVIDQDKFHGVLAIYYNHQPTYRLSFVSRKSGFNNDGDYVKEQTSPNRFTYVLGGNEAGTTAASRLLTLATKPTIGIDDFIDAFAVDKLNEKFYREYEALYKEFTNYLTLSDVHTYRQTVFGLSPTDDPAQRERDEKPVRDFVKKLLGRIVFLYFLQKKGWMGVPTPPDGQPVGWRDGRLDFLRDLFNTYPDPAHFHSRCLTELFFNTLNQDQDQRPNYVFRINGRAPFGDDVSVPYLNGGLFDNDITTTNQIDFPTDYFQRLFAFFGEYNFTIDENNPDEHEVGIDPEMLGHIFENLLEENRLKGTFYTPREVVQYMCQESLIQYLSHRLISNRTSTEKQPDAQAAIESLIRQGDRGFDGTKNFIWRNAGRIEALLDTVTICDPAIGSGAFPMGMLQAIYRTKMALDWTLDPATVKKAIIEKSIHGVDIEAGAVDIARLRFWLSLVVDEEVPEGKAPSPLPNLDYKIMQGDSLLESFEGIRLDTLLDEQTVTYVLDNGQMDIFGKVANPQLSMQYAITKKEDLENLLDLYYDPAKLKERGLKKESVRQDIDTLVHEHIEYNFELAEAQLVRRIAETEIQITDNEASIRSNPGESAQKRRQKETRIEQLRQLQVRLETDLATVRARKDRLYAISPGNKPYFLWHLFFQDVFKQGGFDIVIGNPPYVRQEGLSAMYKEAISKAYPRTHSGTADLLVYFIEKGWQLLKPGGQFAFITSNKWIRTGYGRGLRQLLTEVELQQLLDFNDLRVFEDAEAYPCILLFRKATPETTFQGLEFAYIPWRKGEDLHEHVRANHYDINLTDLDPDGWQLNDPTAQQVLDKLKRAGQILGDYVNDEAYYGLKTGLTEAFVISHDDHQRLLADSSSHDVLRPFMLGRHIRRYEEPVAEKYLIFFPKGFTNAHRGSQSPEQWLMTTYPAIHAYLKPFEAKAKARTDKGDYWWELRACDYYDDFEKPKIMYQTFQVSPCFIYDTGGVYCNNSMWIIPTDDTYLLGFLNSQVGWYCIKQFCTKIKNGYQLIFDYFRKVPVALPNPETRHLIEQLVGQILDSKRHNPVADTKAQEAQIDALLFAAYQLTEGDLVYVLNRNAGLSAAYKESVQNQFRNLERGRFQPAL